MPDTCKCFIFEYLGARHRADGTYGQSHRCIDCGREENDVPEGSVMLGHAPGECDCCDDAALAIPEDQRQRWIDLT